MVDHGFGEILDAWESGSERRRRDEFARYLDAFPPPHPEERESEARQEARVSFNPKKLPVQDRLDLHGMNLQEAKVAVDEFLRSSKAKGYRKVVLIHGKGKNSGNGPVLRDWLARYLEARTDVGASGFEPRNSGGSGATWLILRLPP